MKTPENNPEIMAEIAARTKRANNSFQRFLMALTVMATLTLLLNRFYPIHPATGKKTISINLK